MRYDAGEIITAMITPFKKDLSVDFEALEKELQKCNPESVKLIIVDGVFSMDGNVAPMD